MSASGFRAHDLAELYSQWPHPGLRDLREEDAGFEREQNIQSDLGISVQDCRFLFFVSRGFLQCGKQLNLFAPTDERMGELISLGNFNKTNARLYGGEVFLEWDP